VGKKGVDNLEKDMQAAQIMKVKKEKMQVFTTTVRLLSTT